MFLERLGFLNLKEILTCLHIYMIWKYMLTAQEANWVPGSIKRSVASKFREFILPSFTLLRSHLGSCRKKTGTQD